MVQPFLKWAGGKRWLVKNHAELFPPTFNNYIEPFLGSGAVFFHLQPKRAVLSDANGRLIETYQAIKNNYKLVEKHLGVHQRLHSKEHYYETRARLFQSKFTRAAQFIYLNRTCFNGLYRENKKGVFNVPIGTKTNVLLSTDNFEQIAEILETVDLEAQDFEKTISKAGYGDLVFLDPPYTVAHNLNGFVKYNQKIFSWDDQVRLRKSAVSAAERGAIVIMTNADHDSLRELHARSNIESLARASVIGGVNSNRGKTSELLIRI